MSIQAEKVAIHLLPLLENEWDLIFIVRKITIFNDFSHKIGTFLTWGAICKLTSTNYKSLRNMKVRTNNQYIFYSNFHVFLFRLNTWLA